MRVWALGLRRAARPLPHRSRTRGRSSVPAVVVQRDGRRRRLRSRVQRRSRLRTPRDRRRRRGAPAAASALVSGQSRATPGASTAPVAIVERPARARSPRSTTPTSGGSAALARQRRTPLRRAAGHRVDGGGGTAPPAAEPPDHDAGRRADPDAPRADLGQRQHRRELRRHHHAADVLVRAPLLRACLSRILPPRRRAARRSSRRARRVRLHARPRSRPRLLQPPQLVPAARAAAGLRRQPAVHGTDDGRAREAARRCRAAAATAATPQRRRRRRIRRSPGRSACSAWRIATLPSRMRLVQGPARRRARRPRGPTCPRLRPDELAAYLSPRSKAACWRTGMRRIVNDFATMLFHGLLRRLPRRWVGDARGGARQRPASPRARHGQRGAGAARPRHRGARSRPTPRSCAPALRGVAAARAARRCAPAPDVGRGVRRLHRALRRALHRGAEAREPDAARRPAAALSRRRALRAGELPHAVRCRRDAGRGPPPDSAAALPPEPRARRAAAHRLLRRAGVRVGAAACRAARRATASTFASSGPASSAAHARSSSNSAAASPRSTASTRRATCSSSSSTNSWRSSRIARRRPISRASSRCASRARVAASRCRRRRTGSRRSASPAAAMPLRRRRASLRRPRATRSSGTACCPGTVRGTRARSSADPAARGRCAGRDHRRRAHRPGVGDGVPGRRRPAGRARQPAVALGHRGARARPADHRLAARRHPLAARRRHRRDGRRHRPRDAWSPPTADEPMGAAAERLAPHAEVALAADFSANPLRAVLGGRRRPARGARHPRRATAACRSHPAARTRCRCSRAARVRSSPSTSRRRRSRWSSSSARPSALLDHPDALALASGSAPPRIACASIAAVARPVAPGRPPRTGTRNPRRWSARRVRARALRALPRAVPALRAAARSLARARSPALFAPRDAGRRGARYFDAVWNNRRWRALYRAVLFARGDGPRSDAIPAFFRVRRGRRRARRCSARVERGLTDLDPARQPLPALDSRTGATRIRCRTRGARRTSSAIRGRVDRLRAANAVASRRRSPTAADGEHRPLQPLGHLRVRLAARCRAPVRRRLAAAAGPARASPTGT